MREIATAALDRPSDLIVGLTTVVTVCTALMIWLGLLGRASRATLLWTFAMLLSLLGPYASIAFAAMGTDFLLRPAGSGIACGAPMLVWSGLRAAQGKRPYAWIGFAQSAVSVLLLAVATPFDAAPAVFRWLFLASAIGAILGAAEVMRGAFHGSRFGMPLVAASGILFLLGIVGVVGGASGSSDYTDVIFVRGVIVGVTVYVLCVTVSVLFLANRRPGARDALEAMDAFMTEPMMHAVVREKLQRARGRREQSWSFIDLRLDDAGDLRGAIGEAAFSATVRRFEAIVQETLPAEADLSRVSPGHVLVFASQPSAVVREFVRTVINEIAAPSADAPTSMRLSASGGIVDVDIDTATYEALVTAASEAVERAQREGGDKWRRVGARPAPTV